MSSIPSAHVRFTAWTAVVGGIFAYMNVALVLAMSGSNGDLILRGASMLALPLEARELFRWGMLADILGFYLPLLAIGGYLWRAFREEAGVLGDMALLAVMVYVVLGIVGAAMEQAVVDPLAQLHASGGDAVRRATEAAWTSIAYGVQNGLWWCEGPLVFFWGGVVGTQLKRAGWGRGSLVLFEIVRWGFGLFFVAGFFESLNAIAEAAEFVIVLIFPLWMLLFGRRLLRRRPESIHSI